MVALVPVRRIDRCSASQRTPLVMELVYQPRHYPLVDRLSCFVPQSAQLLSVLLIGCFEGARAVLPCCVFALG